MGVQRRGKRIRFVSTVDPVNALEAENAQGKIGRLAMSFARLDMLILDELGYLPFSQAGAALLFHLLSRSTHHGHIVGTGNESYRFRHSCAQAKSRISAREQSRRKETSPTHPA